MQSECVSGAVEVELLDFRSENLSGEFLLFRNFVNYNYVNKIEMIYESSRFNFYVHARPFTKSF